MLRTTLLALVIAVGMAGCTVEDGKVKSQSATLSYEGEQSGSHEERSDCDEDGQVTGSGRIEDGTLRVKITDGGGDEVWSKTFDGEVSLDSDSLNGASGEWTISADRSGNDLAGDEFNGQYTFNLSC